MKATDSEKTQPAPPLFNSQARVPIPVTTRLSIEIPKPKDWQAFQRNCVLLFRAELNDPHAQEYGRNGQNQGGIDVLGVRDGVEDHFVGVQCRLISKPLKEAKILEDARNALKLKAGLKELVFATTAPDDAGATDAALAVTRILKAEGHNLRVVIYGWGQLQTLIAPHDVAYYAFHPSALSIELPQSAGVLSHSNEMASMVAAQVTEGVKQALATFLNVSMPETGSEADEDPALHARIDTYRDLFDQEGQPRLAEKRLQALLENEDLSKKPWARFRIETNLACIAVDLGRQAEAAARFEVAYSIRPDDPNALSNLALARTMQGRFLEAMEAARAALACDSPAKGAISYLLQAAARSDWEGDPETLVPPEFAGSAYADLGIAEFLRRRETPGWAERCLELARRHPDLSEFKRIKAIAILSIAIESGSIIAGAQGPVPYAEVNACADDMKAYVQYCLDAGFADKHDLVAHLNNAALLLRLCDRHTESEALLNVGIAEVGNEPVLRRLLALTLSLQDRETEAAGLLKDDSDLENQVIAAELQASSGDIAGALVSAIKIQADELSPQLQGVRWLIVGECALRTSDFDSFKAAIEGLRAIDPHDVTATLLEIRAERRNLVEQDALQQRLRELAATMPADVDMGSRYFLACELRNQDLPDEASRLLEDQVDLTRLSPMTSLFLDCLASSRRDAAFHKALAEAAPDVRNNPETAWTVAAHAWNVGDLLASLDAVNQVLGMKPDDPRARLLKVEILIRQDRSSELLDELEKPLERLDWKRPGDLFRLASLLGHFGFTDRAAALAYRLYLEHRDLPRSWMTMSSVILFEGLGSNEASSRWNPTVVGPNVAVDLSYEDGSTHFFVVEVDPILLRLDHEARELDHPHVMAVIGLKKGDEFISRDGRKGVVSLLRHKYVARLHYIMDHYQERFPERPGFIKISDDPSSAGQQQSLLLQLKARHDWINDEVSLHLNGPMPVGVFAHRLGTDTIEAAELLMANQRKLKVAVGNNEEREAAARALHGNAKRGCVLDLLAFWTLWTLGALKAVVATCGPIHLPQSVIDRLRARREKLDLIPRTGNKSARYHDGNILVHEVPREVLEQARADIDAAIIWAEANVKVLPVVLGDDLPEEMRSFLRTGRFDIFDSLIVARQSNLLLLTDDLPTREFDRVFGGSGGSWLHFVFGVALDSGHITLDEYTRWSAHLISVGHNYLGVSGWVLAHAARLDADSGESPGSLFLSISQMIGGLAAEPDSHARATFQCLQVLWRDEGAMKFRQAVTSYLLRQLIRERFEDFPIILRKVLLLCRGMRELSEYLMAWMKGHFLFDEVSSFAR
ncbi:tetratricopeptide repeat protein [Candidatus Phycosocius bacilliformis]|uniref:tetratricopeptide repeat protein n=1 Tax=Candidatus Phycosocius bacilliformis TaxID=1445552 RepID=UPI0010581FBF|nr:hypothetical protein [Candidatus Phycosocius bacilliformis]